MKNQHNTVLPWRRWLLMIFPPLAAILFALALVTPAWADTVSNIHTPFGVTLVIPCNGETVTLSGIEHSTARVTLDGSGGFHLGGLDKIHATGVGDQGNAYVGNSEDSFAINGRVGFDEEWVTDTISIIGKGSAPNFVLHSVFHMTVHPDGTVTGFVNDFTAECRG